MRAMSDIVVIGAGPAGLAAARELSLARRSVTVLEQDGVVGGLSRTVEHDGFRFDIGGHRFFTKLPEIRRMWEQIMGDDFLTRPRLSRIFYRGRLMDYPLKVGSTLRVLGLQNSLLALVSHLWARIRPVPEDSFEGWVINRFGHRLYEHFFRTYTEKVWGIPCTEIRAEWAAQRIQGLSLARAILSAGSLNKRAPEIKTLINSFRYPRLGPGQMWEMCRDRVRDLGGRVLMEHSVTRLEMRGGRVVAVRADTPERYRPSDSTRNAGPSPRMWRRRIFSSSALWCPARWPRCSSPTRWSAR